MASRIAEGAPAITAPAPATRLAVLLVAMRLPAARARRRDAPELTVCRPRATTRVLPTFPALRAPARRARRAPPPGKPAARRAQRTPRRGDPSCRARRRRPAARACPARPAPRPRRCPTRRARPAAGGGGAGRRSRPRLRTTAIRKNGQRNAMKNVRTPAKNPTDARADRRRRRDVGDVRAEIAPATAKITHHPIGTKATTAISSRPHPQRAMQLRDRVASERQRSRDEQDREQREDPDLHHEQPGREQDRTDHQQRDQRAGHPEQRPHPRTSTRARAASPWPTSANPSSAPVVTFTAATTFENAHGKINSPNAAPTRRPSDSGRGGARPR